MGVDFTISEYVNNGLGLHFAASYKPVSDTVVSCYKKAYFLSEAGLIYVWDQ